MKNFKLLLALFSLALLSACGGDDDDDDTTDANDDDSTVTDDDDDTSAACVMLDVAVPNESWNHVARGSEVEYASNPPASGPHYGSWARFEMFDLEVPRGHWVHNLEHGGIVFLYHPDADPDEIEKLKAAYLAVPPDPECDYRRALLTPDPLLDPDKPIAVVAANRLLEGNCVDAEAIAPWVDGHVAQGPENLCGHGVFEP